MSEAREIRDFRLVSLSQLTERITDGSHFSPIPQEQGFLIANVKDMKSGLIDFSTCAKISPVSYKKLKATGCTIRNGDVLLSKDGTVGRVVVYRQNEEVGALSSICIISPSLNLISSYLGHALMSANCVRQYEYLMSGSAIRRLVLRDIKEIKIHVTNTHHQEIIAKILDTLDTAIQHTEAIIEKLKQVKQGLLHDLLTRGIDTNGELRPPVEVAPHLYKDSPLGWIPHCWEYCRMNSVLKGIDAGKSPDCQDVPAKGDQWGVLKVGAVHPDGLKISENKTISKNHQKISSYLIRDGDLLLSRANTPDLVGLVCHVTSGPANLMLSDKTLRLAIKENMATTRFIFLQLQHPKLRTQIEIEATGTSGSMKNIGQKAVERLAIVRPPINEQIVITKKIDSLHHMDELKKISKLKEIKSGLMDDLLTGRVRVTDLIAAQPG